jgi:hypothetical protein
VGTAVAGGKRLGGSSTWSAAEPAAIGNTPPVCHGGTAAGWQVHGNICPFQADRGKIGGPWVARVDDDGNVAGYRSGETKPDA